MHKHGFKLPVGFTGSYTESEPNFPGQSNLILQKKVSGIDKVVNFKDLSRPNKEIKYFLRIYTWLKDFSRWLAIFKTFSRLYKPWKRYGLSLFANWTIQYFVAGFPNYCFSYTCYRHDYGNCKHKSHSTIPDDHHFFQNLSLFPILSCFKTFQEFRPLW